MTKTYANKPCKRIKKSERKFKFSKEKKKLK